MYRLDPFKRKPRPVVEEDHGQSVVHKEARKRRIINFLKYVFKSLSDKDYKVEPSKETLGEGPSNVLQGICSCQRRRRETGTKLGDDPAKICVIKNKKLRPGVSWKDREELTKAGRGFPEFLKQICTDFGPAFFDTLLKHFDLETESGACSLDTAQKRGS